MRIRLGLLACVAGLVVTMSPARAQDYLTTTHLEKSYAERLQLLNTLWPKEAKKFRNDTSRFRVWDKYLAQIEAAMGHMERVAEKHEDNAPFAKAVASFGTWCQDKGSDNAESDWHGQHTDVVAKRFAQLQAVRDTCETALISVFLARWALNNPKPM